MSINIYSLRNEFLKILPDSIFLKMRYRSRFGKKLDIKNPQTFSEKLQWLKLYNRIPEYSIMVDKYAVKQYVADKIGETYVIPTLGVWENFDDVDFGSLPNQFVMKCTHDSGGLVICKDKEALDIDKAREKINKSLKRNFYWIAREWPYKNVPKRIIAEKYISDKEKSDSLTDYKFYCFNGKPQYCQVITARFDDERIDFYDMQWKHQEFTGLSKPYKKHASSLSPKPYTFEKMKDFASILSKDIPFVRVDFYEVDGNLYFGEITFFPAGGWGEFDVDEWNYKMGEMIKLPDRK